MGPLVAKKDLSKLQRVQNCLARVVLKPPPPPPRFPPLLPFRKHLHWLPVVYRILNLNWPLLHIVLFLLNNRHT